MTTTAACKVLALLFLAAASAGCAADGPAPPTPTAADPADPDEGAPDVPPERLVDGENEHVRVALLDHHVADEMVWMNISFANKDDDDPKRLNYLILDTTATETVFFDTAERIVSEGEEVVLSLETDDGEGRARAPWTTLEFYYTRDLDATFTDDEAFALDFEGLGLPSHID